MRIVRVTLSHGPKEGSPVVDVLVVVKSDESAVTLPSIEAELEATEEAVKDALRPFLNNSTYFNVDGATLFTELEI